MHNNNRSPISSSKRVTYLNNETPLRDPSTIFHSPFKNGKRNPEYSNPTLMSSSIFYHNDASIECRNSHVPARSKSPSDQPNQTISKSSKAPRLKRQFDNTQENIKDHFTGGFTIPAERKRALKNYLHAQPALDLQKQLEAIDNNNNAAIKNTRESSRPRNTGLKRTQSTNYLQEVDQQQHHQLSQQYINQSSQKNNFIPSTPPQAFSTPKRNSINYSQPQIDGVGANYTPRSNTNSNIQFPTTPKRNASTTPKREKMNIPNINLSLRSTTPSRVAYEIANPRREENTTPKHTYDGTPRRENSTTPRRQQSEYLRRQEVDPYSRIDTDIGRKQQQQYDVISNSSIVSGGRTGRTPERLKFERQVFPQMKECCDKCINEKIINDKVRQKHEELEKDRINQVQLAKQYELDQKAEKDREHEKILSARRQYGEIATAKKESERIHKETILQEKTKMAEQINYAAQEEMKQEIERNKLEKIKKINEYNEMLREQIIQKDLFLKQQALKENRQQIPQSNEIDGRYQQDTYPQKKQSNQTQSMIDYRKAILGQLAQNEQQKIIERSQEKDFYQKITSQEQQETQKEKQYENQLRHVKKEELQEFIRVRQQAALAQKEMRWREQEELRQIADNIHNQETSKLIEKRAFMEIHKQQFCQQLKQQIDDKEALKKDDKNKGIMRKSGSKNQLVHPSSRRQKEKSSPCGNCHKIVPFHNLALFDC